MFTVRTRTTTAPVFISLFIIIRDEPGNIQDSFMVANTSYDGCALTPTGTNIFAAVR